MAKHFFSLADNSFIERILHRQGYMTILSKRSMLLGLCLLAIHSLGFSAKPSKDEDDSKNPLGCRNVGYQFDLHTLKLLPGEAGAPQAMYFIYNKTNRDINLYQMLDDSNTRNLYLNHAIHSRQWAVLSTSEKNLKYICTVPDSSSRYGKVVDCAEGIKVCEFTNVKYGLNNRGNYWLVSSTTKNSALRAVIYYGIIPAI